MNRELKIIKRRIENLRNDMVLTFIQSGAELSNPEVLRLSQLLDEQLNQYDKCVRKHGYVMHVNVSCFPLYTPNTRLQSAQYGIRLY